MAEPFPSPRQDQLMAYADDQLGPKEAARVEEWLDANPDAAEEVAAWRRQNTAIRAAIPEAEARAHAAAISARLGSHATGRAQLARAATIAAALAIGGLTGWFANEGGPEHSQVAATLVDQAIAAHAVYAVEVLHPVEIGAEQETHLVSWLSNRLGAPLAAPDLTSGGYALVGGRLLPSGDGPAAQFMYENEAGDRITLYAERAATGQLAAFRFEQKDGLNSFYWQDPQLRYALVGQIGQDALKALATQVYQQLG